MKKSMKKLLKRILKEQGGQVLPLVLVMLVIGSTIVAGSLAYAATSVRVGHDSLAKHEQYYAAEAGAKDSVWRFKHDYYTTTANVSLSQWTYSPSPVNGQEMEVTAAFVSSGIYKIVSEAYKDGFSTTVEYYLSGVSVFFSNTATAAGEIETYNKPLEDILFPCKYDAGYPNFPSAADLEDFYGNRNPPLSHSSATQIDTTGNPTIGNLGDSGIYYDNSITIKGEGTVTLNENIFVDGDLDFAVKEWTINLNGNTIFTTGNIKQIQMKGYINGPGCIVAVGDISLFPKSTAGFEDEFVFVMSVSGSVTLKPNSYFYGSVAAGAGDVSLELQPGCKVIHTNLPMGGLDFPDDPDTYEWSVSNWKVDHESVLFVISRVLAPGEVGIPYSQTLIAKNGVKPYTWSVTGLPTDLNLEPSTGVISGIPSSATVFPSPVFTVTVTDANGSTATQDLTIAIHPNVEIPVQTLPYGTVGSDYYYELDVEGGIGPYTWSLTSEGFPALSDWANPVDLADGIISGTPTAAGTYQFSIKVRDGLNAEHGPVILQVTIN
ncbi:MAG TPA: Ig domain-containing protein [Dehalococcoidales bacterium]